MDNLNNQFSQHSLNFNLEVLNNQNNQLRLEDRNLIWVGQIRSNKILLPLEIRQLNKILFKNQIQCNLDNLIKLKICKINQLSNNLDSHQHLVIHLVVLLHQEQINNLVNLKSKAFNLDQILSNRNQLISLYKILLIL